MEKALEHTRLNVIFTSQKAVDTAVAASPKIAGVVNATKEAVAHRGGELAERTVSVVSSLAQKGNQTIQALKNSGASIPTEFKSEGNFDERDNIAAFDEIDNPDPELPDGTKNLGGGKHRLPDGTLMQEVDCQTGQPLTR